jgi:hypothetical protein
VRSIKRPLSLAEAQTKLRLYIERGSRLKIVSLDGDGNVFWVRTSVSNAKIIREALNLSSDLSSIATSGSLKKLKSLWKGLTQESSNTTSHENQFGMK